MYVYIYLLSICSGYHTADQYCSILEYGKESDMKNVMAVPEKFFMA